MPCMIWAAILIEAYIADWPNFWVLLFLQILNGSVGFYEDSKAGDAVAALKASLKPEAQVKRDGRWKKFPAGELVPGDRVALNAGAAVPADCRICTGTPIEVDQAALTGESLPVTMYPGDVAKMGSTVTRGEIDAIVACTGKNTFFGKTAAMIQSVDEMGNFQKVLLKITFFLLCISALLVLIAMGYLVAMGEEFFHALAFGVVLLVASIPIAMQVVCTTTMALGSRKLADQKAIVARLSSIEQMASMTILCSDKTGTLTLNKMVLQDIFPYQSGATENDCLQCAALAAKWKEPAKDALDTLVLNAVDKGPLDAFEQLDYTPFDPVRKRTEAKLRAPDGRVFNVMKGAPNIVLAYCENKEDIRAEFEEQVQNLAERGIRALAVARGFEPGGLVMVGLLTFLDPPRPDTKRTIERAIEQGIGVKMITGDHIAIAKETSRTLGMGDNILLPTELPNYDSNAELPKTLGDDYGEMIEDADGFAQVFPEHKFLIVEALRQKGYSCGMTGDGVNDAPALKRADVGIAVEGSTDAARAAADLILTAPGLSVIVDAIIISRCIFQRMKNYVIYRVACTIQLLAFFFLAVLTIHPKDYIGVGESTYFNLPVVALVVITILNDGTIISIAYDHVEPSPRPERWNLPILFAVATWLGFVAVSSSMLLLHWALDSHSPTSTFQTTFGIKDLSMQHAKCMVYLKISLSDFFTVFTARTQGFFWERAPGSLLMFCACLATISSTILSMNWPFGEKQEDGTFDMSCIDGGIALFTWVYCFIWFFVQDVMKVVLYKVLFHFDVSGLRTEAEKCAERAYATSPEARIGKLEEELSKMKQVVAAMGQSNFQAVKLAANNAL
jgi:H+-transporting ATPase